MILLVALLLAQAPEAPDVARIQAALQRQKLDGWLFYDFRGSDPIAQRVLHLKGGGTRRWYCFIPAQGEPRKLVHAIEPHALDNVPGSVATYSAWRVRDRELGAMLRGARRIAMQYSPRNELPTVAFVDAGTVELVRSLGPEVVSSAQLVAEVESVLAPAELADQAEAAKLVAQVQEETVAEAVKRVKAGTPCTERDLYDFAKARMKELGLEGWPGVSADKHTADPHYAPAEQGSAPVAQNSLLLLDFTGRRPNGIWGDLTRVYFLGAQVPEEIRQVAATVFAARDAALKRISAGVKLPTGAEVDHAARDVIAKAGYADRFLHRTGHSIDIRGHGFGVNNDDFETHDDRRHLDSTCFSIEPGIYLAGRFGVRSEIDVCLVGGKPEVRGGDPQREIPAVLAQ